MVRVRREFVVEYDAPVETYEGMSDDEIRAFEFDEGSYDMMDVQEVCVTVDIDPEGSE
jgi:hypothetical protein